MKEKYLHGKSTYDGEFMIDDRYLYTLNSNRRRPLKEIMKEIKILLNNNIKRENPREKWNVWQAKSSSYVHASLGVSKVIEKEERNKLIRFLAKVVSAYYWHPHNRLSIDGENMDWCKIYVPDHPYLIDCIILTPMDYDSYLEKIRYVHESELP